MHLMVKLSFYNVNIWLQCYENVILFMAGSSRQSPVASWMVGLSYCFSLRSGYDGDTRSNSKLCCLQEQQEAPEPPSSQSVQNVNGIQVETRVNSNLELQLRKVWESSPTPTHQTINSFIGLDPAIDSAWAMGLCG